MALTSAHPITLDTPLWRGHCRIHPGEPFPARADRLDAREDVTTHLHRPGGHHVELLRAADTLELHGYPSAGCARALVHDAQRQLCERAR